MEMSHSREEKMWASMNMTQFKEVSILPNNSVEQKREIYNSKNTYSSKNRYIILTKA